YNINLESNGKKLHAYQKCAKPNNNRRNLSKQKNYGDISPNDFIDYFISIPAEISKKFGGAHMSDGDPAVDVPNGIGFGFVAVGQVQVRDSIVYLKNSASVDYYGLSVVLLKRRSFGVAFDTFNQ
ncbi:hypothetical protein WA026_013842, partial [Henosepilachna vigintioctopunctata]